MLPSTCLSIHTKIGAQETGSARSSRPGPAWLGLARLGCVFCLVPLSEHTRTGGAGGRGLAWIGPPASAAASLSTVITRPARPLGSARRGVARRHGLGCCGAGAGVARRRRRQGTVTGAGRRPRRRVPGRPQLPQTAGGGTDGQREREGADRATERAGFTVQSWAQRSCSTPRRTAPHRTAPHHSSGSSGGMGRERPRGTLVQQRVTWSAARGL